MSAEYPRVPPRVPLEYPSSTPQRTRVQVGPTFHPTQPPTPRPTPVRLRRVLARDSNGNTEQRNDRALYSAKMLATTARYNQLKY